MEAAIDTNKQKTRDARIALCLVIVAGWGRALAAEGKPEEQGTWRVILCLEASGGLGEAASAYAQRLGQVCEERRLSLAGVWLSAQNKEQRGERENWQARLRLRFGARWQEGGQQLSESLAGAVAWGVRQATKRTKGRQTLLLLVGHGHGLLEEDRGAGVPAEQLVRAIQVGVRKPIEVLGLDICYGASVERLWALRQCARYIVASPGLIYQPGLSWEQALRTGMTGPRELAARTVQLGMPQAEGPTALVAVETARLPQLAQRVQRLTQVLGAREDWTESGPLITFARSRTTSWGRREELGDLGQWAWLVERNAKSEEVRGAARGVRQAIEEAVAARWSSPKTSVEASGIGIYFPRTIETVPPAYRKQDFAVASGWAAFLERYWGWALGLIQGHGLP